MIVWGGCDMTGLLRSKPSPGYLGVGRRKLEVVLEEAKP